MLEFDPDVRGGDGFAIARDILDSGRALAKMNAIIDAQGAKPFDPEQPDLAPLSFDVLAPQNGVITGIDNLQIARIARLAGAPKVQGSGVDLIHKLGDSVKAGDMLYRVYAAFPADLEFARQASQRSSGFSLGRAEDVPSLFVEF
jgi:thymidine phosphorylase